MSLYFTKEKVSSSPLLITRTCEIPQKLVNEVKAEGKICKKGREAQGG
jgi:hypothetical protein